MFERLRYYFANCWEHVMANWPIGVITFSAHFLIPHKSYFHESAAYRKGYELQVNMYVKRVTQELK